MKHRVCAALLVVAVILLVSIGRASADQFPTYDGKVGEPFEPNYRNFVNNALRSVQSNFSGPQMPPNTTSSPWRQGQFWYNPIDDSIWAYSSVGWVQWCADAKAGCAGGGGGGGLPVGTDKQILQNASGTWQKTTQPTGLSMNGVLNVRDPTFAGGAKDDCSTPADSAIQAALDTFSGGVGVNYKPSTNVFMPATTSLCGYLLTKPLVITKGMTNFYGAGKEQTLLSPSYFGPVLMVGTDQLFLTNSLISGPGNAIDLSNNNNQTSAFVELSSYLRNHLNGHSAFSIEFMLKIPSGLNSNTPPAILSSDYTNPFEAELNLSKGGTTFWSDPGAFEFHYDSDNNRLGIGATIKESSVDTWVQTYTANNSTTAGNHAVGLYWDGAHVWNCFDGVASTPVAAAGTWSQSPYEAIYLPSQHNGEAWYPDQTTGIYSFPGTMDNLRFSSTARVSSGNCPSVPTTKYTYDANTDLLLTFSSCADGAHYCIENQTGGYALWGQGNQAGLLTTNTPHEIWFPVLGSSQRMLGGNTPSGLQVHDFTAGYNRDSQGIVSVWSAGSSWHDIFTVGTGHGFNFWELNYEDSYQNLGAWAENCCGGIPAGYPGYDVNGVAFEFGSGNNDAYIWNLNAAGNGWTVCVEAGAVDSPGIEAFGGACNIGGVTAISRLFFGLSNIKWWEWLDDSESSAANWLTSLFIANNNNSIGHGTFVGNTLSTRGGAPFIMRRAYNSEGGLATYKDSVAITMIDPMFNDFGEDSDAGVILDYQGLAYKNVAGEIWVDATTDFGNPKWTLADAPSPGTGKYAKWNIVGPSTGLHYPGGEFLGLSPAGCTVSGVTATCPAINIPSWWSAGHRFNVFYGGGVGCTTPAPYSVYASLTAKTSNSISFTSVSPPFTGSEPTDTCEHIIMDYRSVQDILRAPDPISGQLQSVLYNQSGSFNALDDSVGALVKFTGKVYLKKGVNHDFLSMDRWEMSIPSLSFDYQHPCCGKYASFYVTAPASGLYDFQMSMGNGLSLDTSRFPDWPLSPDIMINPSIPSASTVPWTNDPGNTHLIVEGGENAVNSGTSVTSQPTAIYGTSGGSVAWNESPWAGPSKKVQMNFDTYENTTGTAQTIALPGPFANIPPIYGSCPSGITITNDSNGNTTLNLPTSMGSTFTGQCMAEGS
jgi:hypothetical protein